MNLYSIELKVCATAYIKANSQGEAMAIANKLARRSIITNGDGADVPISEHDYLDPSMPEVSVSPAMTITGVWSEFEEKESSMAVAMIDVPSPRGKEASHG